MSEPREERQRAVEREIVHQWIADRALARTATERYLADYAMKRRLELAQPGAIFRGSVA